MPNPQVQEAASFSAERKVKVVLAFFEAAGVSKSQGALNSVCLERTIF